jgi:hypothetical protein
MDEGMFSPALREAIQQGLRIADDVMGAQKLTWPPHSPTTCDEAYSIIRFSGGAEARQTAVDFCRRRAESLLHDMSGSRGSPRQGAVQWRAEASFACAVLFRRKVLSDFGHAWALASAVLQDLGAEGRLYSTVDSVAALALVGELRKVAMPGMVEVNGQRMTTTEAVEFSEPIVELASLEGVIPVAVTRQIVEDWDKLRATVSIVATLATGDSGGDSTQESFKVGDALDLQICVEGGYQDGDLVWVCLPPALSWLFGGGQVKRFSVDLAGSAEVRIPLAATATTTGRGGCRAEQHFHVCLRNMFEEERVGNPGPQTVRVSERFQ